jgi:hypothetical protein
MLRQGDAGSQESAVLHSVPGKQRVAPHITPSPVSVPEVPVGTHVLVMKSHVVPEAQGMAAGLPHSLRHVPSAQV